MREKELRQLVDTRVHRPQAIAGSRGAPAAGPGAGRRARTDMERVMAASTLPALILGGEVSPDQTSVMATWRKTLQLPTVRGFVIGRSLLFPPDDNVAAAVDAVVEML